MNKGQTINLLEFLSPTLVLSYFFFHNIIPVLIGVSISSYLVNINIINNLVKLIKQKLKNRQFDKAQIKNNNAIKINSSKLSLSKNNSKLTLVEIIEEVGYIPSSEENKDSNVA